MDRAGDPEDREILKALNRHAFDVRRADARQAVKHRERGGGHEHE